MLIFFVTLGESELIMTRPSGEKNTEKAKMSKFFNFFPEISETTKLMLKTLKFFSELQIYSKTCKKILVDPS